MSQPRLKCGQVLKYFLARGYTIESKGGDKLITAPKDGNPSRQRQTVRIGHKWCAKAGSELLPAYVAAIKRAFGVTAAEIRANKKPRS